MQISPFIAFMAAVGGSAVYADISTVVNSSAYISSGIQYIGQLAPDRAHGRQEPTKRQVRREVSNQSQHRELVSSFFDSAWSFIVSVLNAVLGFFGIPPLPNGGDESIPTSPPTASPPTASPPTSEWTQYTPNPADWSAYYSTVAESTSVLDHTPDGVLWLADSSWVPWDGTVYDPTTMTKAQFTSTICPSGDTILGLREVFYEHNPFADPETPTKAEVDRWHSLAITHLRKLVGIDHEAVPDHCLFARALWGQERRHSTKWDNDYPEGTCVGSTNDHCGALFIPDAQDQVPYLPEGHPPCQTGAGSEGVSPAAKVNIPWSIKWVRVFCAYLGSEGFEGGHIGPFFAREKFGFSFWDADPSDSNSNAIFRGKWGGTKFPVPWDS